MLNDERHLLEVENVPPDQTSHYNSLLCVQECRRLIDQVDVGRLAQS